MKIAELNHGEAIADRQTGAPTKMGARIIAAVNLLIGRTGGINGESLPLETYTVTTLPDAATNARGLIYVSNETGGATVAFSDGSNWRRVQDRAVVS